MIRYLYEALMIKNRALAVLGISITILLSESSHAEGTVEPYIVTSFPAEVGFTGWEVEDDVVLGGRSSGSFEISTEGHAVFSGKVSLENNGGFSSIQRDFNTINVSKYDNAYIRVKGDGKRYQFRVKSSTSERPSYIFEFDTDGAWQTIEIPLAKMAPRFRGNRLKIPNYPGQTMAHMRFLIANGTAESFELAIDKIWLK